MLTRVRFNVAVRVFPTLTPDLQYQLCNPKHTKPIKDFYGRDKIRLLTHAFIEVDHHEENKENGQEFFDWMGFTEPMIAEIRQVMVREGWKPGAESME